MQFDHIAKDVHDIDAAVEWYERAFDNVRVLYRDDTWAFLDVHGVKMAFLKESAHPAHIAWRVDADKLEELAATFGQDIQPHRDNTRSFYVESPGGLWIEFITYPPDSELR